MQGDSAPDSMLLLKLRMDQNVTAETIRNSWLHEYGRSGEKTYFDPVACDFHKIIGKVIYMT
jgi:hypothetical protein